MKTPSNINTSDLKTNHNEKPAACEPAPSPIGSGLEIQTHIKAGGLRQNHNQTLVQAK